MNFDNLLNLAKKFSQETILNDKSSYGKVAAVCLSNSGKIYIGLSFKTTCNVGFCAETSLIAQMILNGDTKINKLIAYNNKLGIISPCGKCREQLYQLNHENLNCEILLENKITTLKELLPEL